jgi:hypothetical protein
MQVSLLTIIVSSLLAQAYASTGTVYETDITAYANEWVSF